MLSHFFINYSNSDLQLYVENWIERLISFEDLISNEIEFHDSLLSFRRREGKFDKSLTASLSVLSLFVNAILLDYH